MKWLSAFLLTFTGVVVDWHSAQSAPEPGTVPALSTNAYSLKLIAINRLVGALANTASTDAVRLVPLLLLYHDSNEDL